MEVNEVIHMGKYDKLKKQNQQITADIKQDATHFQEISAEYNRVAEIYSAPSIILNDIDRQFSAATKLNGIDITFLFFATALQCIRQYFLTQFKLKDERPDDGQAADNTRGHTEEHSVRKHRYYNPSLAEIISNPVPFDANNQTIYAQGGLQGGGKMGHRLLPGHDPLLGWVVGTANIATSTLTRWDFQSYHIITSTVNKRGGKTAEVDFMDKKADITQIFQHTTSKLFGKEGDLGDIQEPGAIQTKFTGPAIIASSIAKEAIHLKSDVKSKNSLPIPVVATISPKLANTLAKYGFDMANVLTVGKQAKYATLINFIIATIHRLLYDEIRDGAQTMYENRTRKILSYSNVIASASNVIAVAVMETIGALAEDEDLMKKGLKYFDIGGLAITLYRLINDQQFIKNVKIEFLEKQWYDAVVGEDYSFMEVK